VEIREIRPDEHADLAALTVAAYAAIGADLDDDYRSELADVAGRARDAVVLVAVDGGTVVGGVTYVPDAGNPLSEHADAHAASIRMLAVSPDAHRRGIGRRLTEACTARAASEGRESVVLHTIDTNEPAIGFYQALGFERAPELDWQPTEALRLLGLRIEVAFAG
jgi:ribosomal protein S18 acetylase RimI-like enzyme